MNSREQKLDGPPFLVSNLDMTFASRTAVSAPRRRGKGSRDDAVLEDVVLSAVAEVVQVLVKRRGIITLEHVAPLLLKPVERRLCTIRAIPRARGQALIRLCAATVNSG